MTVTIVTKKKVARQKRRTANQNPSNPLAASLH